MNARFAVALVVLLVATSLVAAPITMADWAEQGSHTVEPVEESELREGTPVFQFEDLSPSAQDAVRPAIASAEGAGSSGVFGTADGRHVVYGAEDLPEEFVYSDYAAPGGGVYGIVHDGQLYELTTYWSAGFAFAYWILELPFVVYGLLLGAIAYATADGRYSPSAALVAALPAAGFHLLGPEFDFPLLRPFQFTALGVAAVVGLLVGVAWLEFGGGGSAGEADGASA